VILSNDAFWSHDLRVEQKRKSILSRIGQAKRARSLALKITSIQSHPAFGQYLQSVKDLRDNMLERVVVEEDEVSLRQAQGAVRAYDEMLKYLSKAEDSERALAKNIETLNNELAAMEQQLAQGGRNV